MEAETNVHELKWRLSISSKARRRHPLVGQYKSKSTYASSRLLVFVHKIADWIHGSAKEMKVKL